MSHILPRQAKLERSGFIRLITVLLLLAVDAALLLGGAGTWRWPAAWYYVGLRLVALVVFGVWIIRVNPEIINERGRKPKNTKSFDKIFALVYSPLLLLQPLVAGLDYRWVWSDMALAWRGVGLLALLPGIVLPYAAMAVNAYLTTTVRIQEERGHQVVSAGPYRYMRHPMYVGLICMSLGAPLLLGSWWAFLIGVGATVAAIWRTSREDQTLQAELPGYAAYAQRVPYRLLPGVW